LKSKDKTMYYGGWRKRCWKTTTIGKLPTIKKKRYNGSGADTFCAAAIDHCKSGQIE
jgi:hypothetical protein